MLPRINNSRKEKQPKARDENVRNEIDFLNRNDIQPMGNEAANIQLKENYINMPGEADEDNMSDLSYVEPEEVPIPYGVDDDILSDISESEDPEEVPIPDEVKKAQKNSLAETS